jgi:hypothetical protein
MTNATDAVVEASVRALEFREAAWEADDMGRGCPDTSELSDPALFAVMQYPPADLPTAATEAVQAEATHRGLLLSVVDRWLPLVIVGLLVFAGLAVGVALFTS